MKRFPLLTWPDRLPEGMTNVPWEIVEPHREQAMRNHYQTLERLAERGGLSVDELAAVLEDRDWRKMETADALAVIARHLAGMV